MRGRTVGGKPARGVQKSSGVGRGWGGERGGARALVEESGPLIPDPPPGLCTGVADTW